MDNIALIVVGLIIVGTVIYLYASLVRAIRDEMKSSNLRKVWKNFGLSIAFAILFATTWLGHGIAQWTHFQNEQSDHGKPAEVMDFLAYFSTSTLENWQSEFLQLFSFVVMSALLIHHGSAESKDTEDRIEQIVHRIEQKLDGNQPTGKR
jgi:hypothetical protein